jgi:proteasome accessory factor C
VTAPSGFFIDADVPRAVLRLAPQARWITEEYPVDEVTELSAPDGWVEVRLPVANRRWLSRLLIRLGANAVLVEPATASVEAVDLARQVLHGYD